MSHPLDGNGLETRVGENNLLKAPCGGITREGGLHICFEQGAHGGNPRKETPGDGDGFLPQLIIGLPFVTDPEADGDGGLKLSSDLVNDFLSGVRQFHGGDGLVGKESGEKQVKQVVAEGKDGLLGGKVGPVDVVDPAALPIRIEDRLEQMLPGLHPLNSTSKRSPRARRRGNQRMFRSCSRVLAWFSIRPHTREQICLRKGSVIE